MATQYLTKTEQIDRLAQEISSLSKAEWREEILDLERKIQYHRNLIWDLIGFLESNGWDHQAKKYLGRMRRICSYKKGKKN